MATTSLPHLTNGTPIGPNEWNELLDALNLLLANTISLGGTVGDVSQDATFRSNIAFVTTNSTGDFRIYFDSNNDTDPGTTPFVSKPACILTGPIGNPNIILTVDNTEGTGTNNKSVRGHCHIANTNQPAANTSLNVNWIAVKQQ